MDAPLGAGMDVDALGWTDSVHDYSVAVNGDLVVEARCVGFAASLSVDTKHSTDTTVAVLR